MNFNGNMTQNTKMVFVSAPANKSSAAATTEWISLKNWDGVRFIVQTGAWAAGTAAVTFKQAINVSGSSSAALTFTTYYVVSGDTATKTTATSNTFNLATASRIYMVEFRASDLTPGKDCINMAIAAAGGADYYGVIAELYGGRYLAGASSPTAITD